MTEKTTDQKNGQTGVDNKDQGAEPKVNFDSNQSDEILQPGDANVIISDTSHNGVRDSTTATHIQ